MNHIPPKVTITGYSSHNGSPSLLIPVKLKRREQIGPTIAEFLETHDHNAPLMLTSYVGSGKTYAVKHYVTPWAKARALKILYISSRAAINAQVKMELLDELGLSYLRKEYTDEGLRAKEDFGTITIVTYHKLRNLMKYEPDRLREYNIVIFDEVHALIEDATFVGITGQVLDEYVHLFCFAQRIYMSATPDDILPFLVSAKKYHPMTVFELKGNYSYVTPYFFSDKKQIIDLINKDKSDGKWMVYLNSISQGEKFADELECKCCMLNSLRKKEDPQEWHQILEQRKFEEKVALVTSIVDAGVSFNDDALTNVVIFTTSPSTLMQVLGRKRCKEGETVNLYVHCPAKDTFVFALRENLDMQDILASFDEYRSSFLNKYILNGSPRDLRNMMYVDENGQLALNWLAMKNYELEAARLTEIIKYCEKHKDPHGFERFVCKWLRIPLPPRRESWLDHKVSGKAEESLLSLLEENLDVSMDEAALKTFAVEFSKQCIASYGKEKCDRSDRAWGDQKINNKLRTYNLPYKLIKNGTSKSCILQREN